MRRSILSACALPSAAQVHRLLLPPSAPRRVALASCQSAAVRDRAQVVRHRIPAGAEPRQRAACGGLYAMIPGVEQKLRVLAARIGAARRVTVMTGAGVSAASGVPTF